MLLSQFISYLSLEKNYSKHTVKAYENDIIEFSHFCEVQYGIADIDKLDYSLIRLWIVNLSEREINNRSINRKISSLKSYFKFLQKIGVLDLNPLVNHKALKTSKKIEIPFSELEMQNVLSIIEYTNDFEGVSEIKNALYLCCQKQRASLSLIL